jgi:hypothetical protein
MFTLTRGGLMTDAFSKDGADIIALSIMTHWRSKGVDHVKAWAYMLPTGDWGVRSNLVGGMPPRIKKGTVTV